ncbi:MAG TPA: diguanylate cyclase [Candidatus Sulfotelmatobacter sp.]|jgi:PAS domain S-box-containing protein|nr:diguanylate cyclase [Candidatus Sulfotelmatobacter sp.]
MSKADAFTTVLPTKECFGYSAAELGETSAFEQIHPDDRFKILEATREARETGMGKRLEYRIKHKDGSWKILESVASTVRDAKGEVAKLVIVNRDITERKRAEQQLEHNLFHDPMTGLPNRRLFLDRLQSSFVRARRGPGQQYALLLANIDHFKIFNETMGASAGDQVLQEIARRLGPACDRTTRSRGATAAVLSKPCCRDWEAMNSPSCSTRSAIRATPCASPRKSSKLWPNRSVSTCRKCGLQ